MSLDAGPVSLALQGALGHPAPFTKQELQLVHSLTVHGTDDSSALSACSELRLLTLRACGDQQLEFIGNLPKLAKLTIIAVPLREVASIAKLQRLTELELFFTQVEDLSPMMAASALQVLRIDGTPLTNQALESHVPALEERGVKVEVPLRSYWAVCRQLHEAGTGTVFGQYGGPPLLVRPGVPKRAGADCDFIDKLHPGVLRMKLGQLGMRPDALFDTLLEEAQAHREVPTRLIRQDHIEQGSATTAEAWVDQLPKESATPLRRVIRRFPRQRFQRFKASAVSLSEARHRVKLPPWIQNTVLAFAGFADQGTILVQFGEVRGNPETQARWYALGLLGPDNETERAVTERDGLFQVAKRYPVGNSTLAINLNDPDDHRVYEFDEELADHTTGLRQEPRVAFDSYWDMWGAICAIRLANGTVVQASED